MRGLLLSAWFVSSVACSAPAPKAEGVRCHQAVDCEPGLACVPRSETERICSRDLSGLGTPATPPAEPEPEPDGGSDAGRARDGGRNRDSGSGEAGADAAPRDATAD